MSSFLEDARAYLERRQKSLREDFDLGRWSRYDYDQDAGSISFSASGEVGLIADIQIVGSTSNTSGTWLWAWDNPSILPRVKHCLREVRAYGRLHHLKPLITAKWPGDECDGWEMASAAAYVLQAEGAYRSPGDKGAVFMILRNLRRPGVDGARAPSSEPGTCAYCGSETPRAEESPA